LIHTDMPLNKEALTEIEGMLDDDGVLVIQSGEEPMDCEITSAGRPVSGDAAGAGSKEPGRGADQHREAEKGIGMSTIKIGDKVMGSMGVVGGYAGTVTAIKRDGRHTIIYFVDDEGAQY